MDTLEVKMGDLHISDQTIVLSTSGVGSCIAVCMYVSSRRIGSMAHVMLPNRLQADAAITPDQYRYTDVAIAVMVSGLEAMGVPRSMIVAKIAGGANMFPSVQGRSQKVGEKNIEAVKSSLETFSIALAGEDVGGTHGRSVVFDLSTGIVTIKTTL